LGGNVHLRETILAVVSDFISDFWMQHKVVNIVCGILFTELFKEEKKRMMAIEARAEYI
jgi:hypothetical protein